MSDPKIDMASIAKAGANCSMGAPLIRETLSGIEVEERGVQNASIRSRLCKDL